MLTPGRLFACAVPFMASLLAGLYRWDGSAALKVLAAPKPPVWHFDLLSAGIGFALGLAFSILVFSLWRHIAALWEAVLSRAIDLRARVSRGVRERYREQVVQTAERSHLLRRYASLSQVYVEPALIIPYASPLAERLQEEGPKDAWWREVALHDLWHCSQVTIDISSALKQSRGLAILGPMGSGRTTLLAHLALCFAQGDGWRLTLPEQRETDPIELRTARERERNRLPVWVGLGLLDLSRVEAEIKHALVEPILGCLTGSLRGIVARPSESLVRSQIIQGRCLLLLDGLDVLGPDTRQRALDWLQKLRRTYPENVLIVTGAPEEYGSLWKAGFSPLLLDGLGPRQASRLVQKWESLRDEVETDARKAQLATAKTAFEAEMARAKKEGHPPPVEGEFALPGAPERLPGVLSTWRAGRRPGVMPIDVALAALLWREQDDVPQTSLARHAHLVLKALDRIPDSLLAPPQWARALASVAWTMLNEGRQRAHRTEFEVPIAGILAELAPVQPEAGEGEAKKAHQQPDLSRQARAVLDGLLRTDDLLVAAGHGNIEFTHPTFQNYLAAQHAARNELAEQMVAHVQDPRWQDVIGFYSALANVTPLVMERLKVHDDLFRAGFLAAADWMVASSEVDHRLRGGVLAELAQVFLDPSQSTALRRQAARAIAEVGDRGTLHLFGQALRHTDPHVRRLGVWALAQMGDIKLAEGLLYALSDADLAVRVEALYALVALGGERLIEGLVRGLQDEQELPRRVAAEGLASAGDEGFELLKEAAKSDDIHIRRAAAYGLGAVAEPWARAIVERMSTEDKEWYVRSAAIETLEKAQAGPPRILIEPPRLENEAWLVTWAAQQAMGVGTREAAVKVALRAVQEGDWQLKLAGADGLRATGDVEVVSSLSDALADADILVREDAYVALYEIARRAGIKVALKREKDTTPEA